MSRLLLLLVSVPLALASGPAWYTSRPLWRLQGAETGGRFGSAIAWAGDVDGDGNGEFLVGAPGQGSGGRAFLHGASGASLGTAPLWTAQTAQTGSRFGASVAGAGDVNGDGYDDAVVGEPDFGPHRNGRALLFLGSALGLSSQPSWVTVGQGLSDYGGALSSAGDVNADGFADLLVGAPFHSHGQLHEGAVFLFLGSPAGLSPQPAWSVESDQLSDYPVQFGAALAKAGDVNGDGFDDVLIGAPTFTPTFDGRVELYLGGPTGLSTTPAWTKLGTPGAFLGSSVAAAGDVDADGFDDVVLSAPVANRVYLFRGSASGPRPAPDWTRVGRFAAGAGDLDHDGFDDVAVARSTAAGEPRIQVHLGSSAGLAEDPAWFATNSGTQLAAPGGDVNGDGFADLLVSDPTFDDGELDLGEVVLFAGTSPFLSAMVFAGEGVNRDVIEPVNVVTGSSWSAPVQLEHAHGASGLLVLDVRTNLAPGPIFASPLGGRSTQALIAGPSLARIVGTFTVRTGDIPPQAIPDQAALVGLAWAAQYTVVGGGHADLSQAVFGRIDGP